MIKICLPGCLPVTPGLASGYLPGCGPFLKMRNIGGVSGGVNGRKKEICLGKWWGKWPMFKSASGMPSGYPPVCFRLPSGTACFCNAPKAELSPVFETIK